MTELELAIQNTKQFNDYSKIKLNFLNEGDRELLVIRLKEYRKDNIDYFTCGEACGINHVINMLVAGKI